MHFKSNLNAVSLCKCSCLGPVRNYLFIPLPIKDSKKIFRPRACYPVGILCSLVVTGATGEGYNGIHAELFSKKNSVSVILVILGSYLLIRMKCISVNGESADLYNVGASISLVMMILILISMAVMNRFSDEEGAVLV